MVFGEMLFKSKSDLCKLSTQRILFEEKNIPFLYFLKNLVWINWRNGLRYQRVLAWCAF